MKEELKNLVEMATEEAKSIKTENDYLNIKSKYLGKKVNYPNMSSLKDMTVEDKKKYGPLFNKIKNDLEALFTNYYENAINGEEKITFDQLSQLMKKMDLFIR